MSNSKVNISVEKNLEWKEPVIDAHVGGNFSLYFHNGEVEITYTDMHQCTWTTWIPVKELHGWATEYIEACEKIPTTN